MNMFGYQGVFQMMGGATAIHIGLGLASSWAVCCIMKVGSVY